MKLRVKLSLLFVLTLISLMIVDISFKLLNQPSDADVAVGVVSLLGLFIVYPAVVYNLLFKRNK